MGFSLNDILNDASKKQGTGKREGFKVTAIPLDKIIPAENNFYDTSEIEDLAASIEASGLLHNIVVQAADVEGLYRIVSGERRYLAYKLLYEDGNEKYSAIPAIIKTYESEEDAELDLIFSNSTARELSDYEKTEQARRIRELLLKKKEKGHKFQGRMREIVAKILNVSTSQVQRMEQIDRHLTPEFKGEFAAGNIGITDAFELSRKPEEEQAAAYAEFKQTGAVKKPEARKPEKKADKATDTDKPAAVPDHKPGTVKVRLDRGAVKRRLLHIAETIEITGGRNLTDIFMNDVKETCIAAAELIDQA